MLFQFVVHFTSLVETHRIDRLEPIVELSIHSTTQVETLFELAKLKLIPYFFVWAL